MIEKNYLTAEDIKMLHDVMIDAGYTVDIASVKNAGPNVAAMLLVQLFQEGVRDPAELSSQLVRRFGRSEKSRVVLSSRVLPAEAIRGLYSPGRSTGSMMEDPSHLL